MLAGLTWATRATSWPCLRTGTRIRSGVRLLERRSETDTGVVKGLPHRYRGHVGHRSLLHPDLRHSDRAGIQVVLLNAQHTKNVPGRKSDVQECQWLMKLHTYGLLRDSFQLEEKMEGVRTIWRLRDRHVKDASRAVQHMQKALTKMNIQLANVISDISGLSGQAIVTAVLQGERDPYKLADLADYRVKASREEV